MSTTSYLITYLNGDRNKTIRVNLTEFQVSGMRTLIAAVPTLKELYGETNNAFRSILTDRDLLRIELDTTDEDVLAELTQGSKELADPGTTLTQVFELFEDPSFGPLNEMEFLEAFGEDVSPGVIVTDGAISSEDNVPVSLYWNDQISKLLSFNSRDGSKTVLIAPSEFATREEWGYSDFESGVLYALKLIINVYNLNYDAKMTYPLIYSLQLSEPKQLVGFVNSSDLGVEGSTRLQY